MTFVEEDAQIALPKLDVASNSATLLQCWNWPVNPSVKPGSR